MAPTITSSQFFLLVSVISLIACNSVNGQLSPNFYATTCSNLQTIVRDVMRQTVTREPRMGASILRLFFHDCFVQGCDGSILLDDKGSFTGEKNARPNSNSTRGYEVIDAIKTRVEAACNNTVSCADILALAARDGVVLGCDGSILLDDTGSFTGEKNARPNSNSTRGYEVIDAIKTRVEAACNNTVSCADILALAARDGVVLLGGQSWQVPLGRRDSRTASLSGANSDLPSPFADLPTLISMFAAKGLTAKDMTVLSGGHAIGFSQCLLFRTRIYNETNIDPAFAKARRANCPFSGGDTNLGPFDNTPNRFDNKYYQNLVARRGLLHSDQVLFNNGTQDATVRTYSTNAAAFLKDFGDAMVKMGNIGPLTGTNGEIRRNCRVINS